MLSALAVFLALLVCVGNAGPAAYPLDKEGFIRDWLVAGPYPNPQAKPEPEGFAKDLLAHLGGEANIVPYSGMTDEATFLAEKGKLIAGSDATNDWGFTETRVFPVTWMPLHRDEEDPIISLDGHFGEIRDWLAAFAACWVRSPSDRSVQLRVGSDDGYKLYLNHELLGGLTLSRAARRDQNIHPGRLYQGLNLILLKITDRTGGHAFCLRITDNKGKPYEDLEVILGHPKTEFAAQCENVDVVDVVDGEGFAKIRLGEEPRFPGRMKLSILLGLAEPKPCQVQVLVTDGSGREVFSKVFAADLSPSEAIAINKNVKITGPGQATVGIQVKDADSEAVLAYLSRTFEVLDVEALRQEREALRQTLADRNRRKATLETKLAELKKQIAALRGEVAEQYTKVAELYTRRREVLAKRHEEDGRSIDEPFAPAESPRETLCLNGDGWEIAAARSLGGGKIDDKHLPEEGWEPGWVPMMGVELYFRPYFFPAAGPDNGPNDYRYGPTNIMKCAPPGWTLADARISRLGLWYRTTIDIPKRWQERRVFFTTEYACHKLFVFLDGKLCGTYVGWPGRICIELTDAAPGQHELAVLAARALAYGRGPGVLNKFFGLLGDVLLTTTSNVAVTDTWIITSWRNANIEARIWLINRGNEAQTVTVGGQVVRAGRTRLDLGSQEVKLNPGVITEVRFKHPWIDPELWGIGGKYGKPNLYHLVAAVKDGEEVLDQHFTRFGFRELWKEGFHFYLNGKRIFIQGDNIGGGLNSRPRQVIWQNLLRDTCNVNAIRTHFEFQQGMYARVADELGMLLLPQWYPKLRISGRGEDKEHALSVEEFLTTEEHHENLRLYANWVKWLRNHPSVVIYCTDNEIFTQAGDIPEKLEQNIRHDRLGAVYGRWVKELDPTRLVTRDGDQGTWGKLGKWQEYPPADIANYHYPDFNTRDLVENWESLYEKPVLFGETLYGSYGAWDDWIDAVPSQVATKAKRCRTVLSLYRDLQIPGWIGMGPGLDCFTELKEDGSGNPWGISPAVVAEYKANEQVAKLPHYPYFPIKWPSLSGPGFKPEFYRFLSHYGHGSVNTYFGDLPVYVPNAVNAAYKESTHPMPPLVSRRPTEVLITVTENSHTVPFAWVLLTPKAGQACPPMGVRADSQGQAWFVLEEGGTYEVRVQGKRKTVMLDLQELPFEMKAGFDYLPRITVEVRQ